MPCIDKRIDMAEAGKRQNGDLRVGVLGCGSISADHLAAWARCRGARVVALCDTRPERAQTRGSEFGIEAVYDSPQRLFEAERLDLVDIVTPRETHAGLIRLAASRGVHVLCEKPLATDLAEAESLLREVRDQVRIMVNENWRYRDYLQQVCTWLRSGRLGTVVQARIALWRSGLLRRDDGMVPALQRQPFIAREQRLLIAELLIHQLDVARALFGEVEIVAATLGRASNDVVGEDCAVVVLQTDYGLTVVVDGVLSAAGFGPRAGDRIEIAGTRCSIVFDNGTLLLRGAEDEAHRYDESTSRRGSFETSVQHFVDQINNGGPFWTPAVDHLATMRLVEQAYILAGETGPVARAALPPHRSAWPSAWPVA
jgi:predicted dehydrogenase